VIGRVCLLLLRNGEPLEVLSEGVTGLQFNQVILAAMLRLDHRDSGRDTS